MSGEVGENNLENEKSFISKKQDFVWNDYLLVFNHERNESEELDLQPIEITLKTPYHAFFVTFVVENCKYCNSNNSKK